MKRSEVNRDPERARKRATSDLRCAAKKLGAVDALNALLTVHSSHVVRLLLEQREPKTIEKRREQGAA